LGVGGADFGYIVSESDLKMELRFLACLQAEGGLVAAAVAFPGLF
jgi:hypothetical protein